MAFILVALAQKWDEALKEAVKAGAVKIGYDEKEGEQE